MFKETSNRQLLENTVKMGTENKKNRRKMTRLEGVGKEAGLQHHQGRGCVFPAQDASVVSSLIWRRVEQLTHKHTADSMMPQKGVTQDFRGVGKEKWG